jgi:hypothetical protein
MDRRTSRTGRAIIATASVAVLAPLGSGHAPGTASVTGATPAERRVVTWVVERFDEAGLTLPTLAIAFHADPAGCHGNSGLFREGRLDVCTRGKTVAYQRNVVMHELAHAWSALNLTHAEIVSFTDARALSSWNDPSVPWGYRGFEQAAEVITWGIGDRAIAPLIPGDPDEDELGAAFELLTGRAPRP